MKNPIEVSYRYGKNPLQVPSQNKKSWYHSLQLFIHMVTIMYFLGESSVHLIAPRVLQLCTLWIEVCVITVVGMDPASFDGDGHDAKPA